MNTCCEELISTYLYTWHLASAMPSHEHYSWPVQLRNYHRFKHRMKKVCKSLSGRSEIQWKDLQHDPDLTKLFDLWLQIDAEKMRQAIKDDYVSSSEMFIRRVKDRWPAMDDESVFQALRNIWIMNLIQLLAGIPVEVTDAMFAYSMLYPLTDNVIDDPQYTSKEKLAFVKRLGDRLRGERLEPSNDTECDVFDMVALIEKQYDRELYPEVYESILWIHDAQIKSLSQQYDALTRDTILHLSFEKGAASVVADGYLVMGTADEMQLDFFIGYGITLQLADDLQDLESDAKIGHQTLFSTTKTPEELSIFTRKLCALAAIMHDKLPCDRPDIKAQIEKLLTQSLMFLIHDAINTHKKHFAKGFLRKINQINPYGLKRYDKLKALAGKWIIKLKPRLAEQFESRFSSL